MEQHSIISICLSAVAAIFIILPLLALIMQIIVALFPKNGSTEAKHKPVSSGTQTDTAVFAAISTAYKNLYPGTQIKEITENK